MQSPRPRGQLRQCAVMLASLFLLGALSGCGVSAAALRTIPSVQRETRGLFVTTAFNIDWPSQPGLDPLAAEDEIDAIIARAQELNCNTIYLQVRAFGDRIYSKIDDTRFPEVRWALAIDPGQHNPGFDPLEEWITRCHVAGLEVHAWFNPFRIDIPIRNLPCYDGGDGYIYLDASSTDVQNYVIDLMEDLLNKYYPPKFMMASPPRVMMAAPATTTTTDDDGLDGIIIDHYFPPDPGFSQAAPLDPVAHLAANRTIPTTLAVKRALSQRRQTMLNQATMNPPYPAHQVSDPYGAFIERAYHKVKEKGGKFGLSPSADQKALVTPWLQKKWMDYLAPEIYVKNPNFGFELDNWISLNTGTDPKPLIVPVIYTTGVQPLQKGHARWDRDEIDKSVAEARDRNVGHIHYSYHAVRSPAQSGPDPDHNAGDLLKEKRYKEAAAIADPSATAINVNPTITKKLNGDYKLDVTGVKVRRWAIWFHDKTWGWGKMRTHPLSDKHKDRDVIEKSEVPANTDLIAVRGLDRHSQETDVATRAP